MDASFLLETTNYAEISNFENHPLPVFDQQDSSTTRSASPTSSSSSTSSSEGEYPSNNVVLKFISDLLMEEDMEGKTCMLQDCLALQAQEKSFYDVLGQEYPYQPNSSDSSSGVENSASVLDQSNLDYVQSFRIDSPQSTLAGPEFQDNLNKDGARNCSSNSSRGRKNHKRGVTGDFEEEGSISKHAARSLPEPEKLEELDDILLCVGPGNKTSSVPGQDNVVQKKKVMRKSSKKKQGSNNNGGGGGEVVDLSSLLNQCAQAVASNDHRTSSDLILQMRKHSSPFGDGNQRLAHYFANGLEARLAGARARTSYTSILSNSAPMADALKAYQVFVKVVPMKRISYLIANRTIMKRAEKATSLHIIDFGILYGFQWPCLIRRLSERRGGAPKLRITGIDFPQPGFRPAERVEETGHRLRRYCERFGVESEYHAIAQKWETINYEDFHIDSSEMTVVNCLYRFKNLTDDTVVPNSARDAVLNLIHRIKPEIFVHGVVNGNFNAPFFVTRFREALFYFSSLFDMFDVTVPREDEQRLVYEKETLGRDIMNVLACEGTERVERPETYRQWQARNLRTGFRQIELHRDLVKIAKDMVRSEYDKEFVVGEDGQWMLQGWKGRIIYALSVWKPV